MAARRAVQGLVRRADRVRARARSPALRARVEERPESLLRRRRGSRGSGRHRGAARRNPPATEAPGEPRRARSRAQRNSPRPSATARRKAGREAGEKSVPTRMLRMGFMVVVSPSPQGGGGRNPVRSRASPRSSVRRSIGLGLRVRQAPSFAEDASHHPEGRGAVARCTVDEERIQALVVGTPRETSPPQRPKGPCSRAGRERTGFPSLAPRGLRPIVGLGLLAQVDDPVESASESAVTSSGVGCAPIATRSLTR